jgi:pimeloyl-ACP methyl ester carboxylesterase
MTPLSALPIVIIPGIQGRWEWMRPAIDALRQERRVYTFSLNDEGGEGNPFDYWLSAIDGLAARAGSDRIVLIGVSFGGLVAVRYAALHPDKVAALVLVSTPSPGYRLSEFDEGMLRRPLSRLPLFAMRGVRRLAPEIRAAKDTWHERIGFALSYGWQVIRRPAAPTKMARWVRAWQAADISADCAQVTAPTHLITGEPRLDRVVPVQSTLHYLTLIPGSTFSRLDRTGHIGLVSRPRDFSFLVHEFLHVADDPRARRSA